MRLLSNLKRILGVVLAVAIVLTTMPIMALTDTADEYPAMEFVVSADKNSVKSGESFVLTITLNGRMKNLSLVQYELVYSNTIFTVGQNPKTAFDENWRNDMLDGNGLGAIDSPAIGKDKANPADSSTIVRAVEIYNEGMDGETDEGDAYPLFISEHCDLYDKTTAVAGKIKFTANEDIDDISDLITLQSAKTAYRTETEILEDNIAGTVIQLADMASVTAAINAIDAIVYTEGSVTYSSKASIEAAKAAYDKVLDSLKASVTNYSELKSAIDALAVIEKKIDGVKALIDLVENVDSTDDKADVEAARKAYNALEDDEKAAITDYETKLKNAEAAIVALEKAKAAAVEALIDEIGTVTKESGKAIENAETALKALTESEKQYVDADKITALENARKAFNNIELYTNTAKAVTDKIDLIPSAIDKSNLTDAKSKVEGAESAYSTAEAAIGKEILDEYIGAAHLAKLSDAKDRIADIDEAMAVESLISNLGKITLDSGDKLEAIKDAFDDLSAEAKDLVENYGDYELACQTYEELCEDEANVQAVIAIIEALGDAADITLDDEDAIVAAEGAYGALESKHDPAIQARVTNYSVLTAARARYDSLVKISNVEKLINNIGTVTLESSSAIQTARSAYNNKLTLEEQAEVSNYQLLLEAEARLEELMDELEQEAQDKLNAGNVDKLIDAIKFPITLDSIDAIEAAESAYDDLGESAKAFVTKHQILVDARSEYDVLKADDDAVTAVENAIDAIGVVELSNVCLEKIEAAEEKYKNLKDELKGKVENYKKLTAARDTYDALELDDSAVKNVVSLIETAVSDVSYPDSFDALDAAQRAYDALRADLKDEVTNYSALTAAWELYNSLKPVVGKDGEYNGKHLTVIHNIGDGMVVKYGETEARAIKIDGVVYHVLVTDEEVDENRIVVAAGTPTEDIMGDVVSNGDITANDIQMVCRYFANKADAIERFENDPMAFVRADVNGDGTIDIFDMLAIAVIAKGNPDAIAKLTIKLHVGMKN